MNKQPKPCRQTYCQETGTMRQGPQIKRPRGRSQGGYQGNNNQSNGGGGNNNNRKPGSARHQTFDSNGPDTRVRGTAIQVYEKYMSLARDATTSGDRVMAENYYQHAEHYYRIIASFSEGQPYIPQHMQQRDSFDYDQDDERAQEQGDAGAPESAGLDVPQPDLQPGENPRVDAARTDAPRPEGGRYEGERREPRRDYRNEGRNEPRGDYNRGEPRADYNRGEPRGEYNRNEPRADYNRGEPRADYNRGESRGEYNRNEPRAEYRGERRPDPRQDQRGEPRQDPRNDQRPDPRADNGDFNEHPAFLRQPARRPRDEQEPRQDQPRNEQPRGEGRPEGRGRGRSSYQGGYEQQPYEQPAVAANAGPVTVITPAGGGLPPLETAPIAAPPPPAPVVVEAPAPAPTPVVIPIAEAPAPVEAVLPLDLPVPESAASDAAPGAPTEPPKRKRGRPPKVKPPVEA